MKKLAIQYDDGKVKYDKVKGLYYYKDKEGYLYSKGIYITKLKEEDLPDYYVKLWLSPRYTYISLQGIKYIYYRPNFFTNHRRKDDLLFISYNNKIVLDERKFPDKYDTFIHGPEIDHFIEELEKYGFDKRKIKEVKNLMIKKDKWYDYWDKRNWNGDYTFTSEETWKEILGNDK